jgi:hypothetical protein
MVDLTKRDLSVVETPATKGSQHVCSGDALSLSFEFQIRKFPIDLPSCVKFPAHHFIPDGQSLQVIVLGISRGAVRYEVSVVLVVPAVTADQPQHAGLQLRTLLLCVHIVITAEFSR